MRELEEFVAQFNVKITLDDELVVKRGNRYYLLSERLRQQVPDGFFYAGVYLGAVKGAGFFPSFLLLGMLAEDNANSLIVDSKTAWLFICGRDIFRQGILGDTRLKNGDYTLIMNEHNECLGFGKVMADIRQMIDLEKIAVKNILDIGDFLRREKRQTPKNSHENRDRNFHRFNHKQLSD